MVEEVLEQVSAERIREDVRALEGVRHPVTAPEALQRAEEYILASLRALPYQVELHPFTFDGREYHNIVATRPGAGQPGRRVLVIAHYDTVENSPGADDNASSVALALELARVLQGVELERTVQIAAVNLEERQKEGTLDEAALFGSRALAAEVQEQGWEIEGAIVLDTIAYAGKQHAQKTPNGVPITLPEVGDFIGAIGNEASSGLVTAFMQAVARYKIPLPVVPLVVPGNGEVLPDTRRSDHAPFWDRGYRVLFLTDTANFRSPHYHQPSDTLETINVPFVAEVCRAVAAMVVELAGGRSTGGRL